jgi:hypothetical protein
MDNLHISITTGEGDRYSRVDLDLSNRSESLAFSSAVSDAVIAGSVAAIQSGWTKVLADGTHVAGSDSRTDHVAVIDHSTGLMWSVESLGSEADADEGLNHEACAKRAAALRLLGHEDWRPPTRTELAALVDDTRREPAIDTALFPRVKPRWHWTSTPWIDSDGKASASVAWYVNFGNGYVYHGHRGNEGFALAVRRPGQ